MKLKDKFIMNDPTERLYHCPIPIVGITGGIGTGKSTVANIFREFGINIIDADAIVKEIYLQEETIQFVGSLGNNFLANGKVQFPVLRRWAFQSNENKKKLESFMYGRLPKIFFSKIKPDDKVIIYDIPLLFEKDLLSKVDTHILVYAPREVQIERTIKRDGSDKDTILKIINGQMDIEAKKEQSSIVIENNNNLNDLKMKTQMIKALLFSGVSK